MTKYNSRILKYLGVINYTDSNNFLASMNNLLSTDGISLESGSFIYSTSGLNDGLRD